MKTEIRFLNKINGKWKLSVKLIENGNIISDNKCYLSENLFKQEMSDFNYNKNESYNKKRHFHHTYIFERCIV